MAPDGRQVVFADAKTGDLAIHDLVTDTDRRLTKVAQPWNDHADAAVMSRDGRHIAFSWYVGNKGRYELRLLASEATSASSPKVLIDNQDISYIQPFEWSPDGRWIAVQVKREDSTAQIALVDSREGSLRTLKTIDWRGVSHLAFSPDGRHLAFDLPVTDDARQRDLLVLSADGSRETAVDTQPGYDTALGWSPDGKSLFFTSDRSGARAMWMLPMADGRPEGSAKLLYANLGTFADNLGVTASGSLAYIRKAGAVNVFSVAMDFSTGAALSAPEPLTDSYLWDHGHQSWSPDGRFTVYSTFGRMARALIVRTVATALIRDITPKVTNFSFPRWSSDRFIVFQGSDLKGGREGIYRLDVETGEVSPVATGDGYLSWASSTRDGRFVVFGRNITGQPMSLVVKDMTTGVERDLVYGSIPISHWRNDIAGTAAWLPTERATASPTGSKSSRLPEVNRKRSCARRYPTRSGTSWTGCLTAAGSCCPRARMDEASWWSCRWTAESSVELKLPARATAPLRVHPDGRRLSYVSGDSAFEVRTLEYFLPAATSTRK